jgi:hypothetical protein
MNLEVPNTAWSLLGTIYACQLFFWTAYFLQWPNWTLSWFYWKCLYNCTCYWKQTHYAAIGTTRLNIKLCKSNAFITRKIRTVLPSHTLPPPIQPTQKPDRMSQPTKSKKWHIICYALSRWLSVWNMEKHKYLDIMLTTCIFKDTALTKTNYRYLNILCFHLLIYNLLYLMALSVIHITWHGMICWFCKINWDGRGHCLI